MLRLSELYTNVQGECQNVGKPTQFVRFGLCNYRCPGWPCDSMFAVDPKYRDQWEKLTAKELFNRLEEWPKQLTLTGGESLLQPENELSEFVELALTAEYKIDCFTNGSIPIPNHFLAAVQFILDWKLPGSGEYGKDMGVRTRNAERLNDRDGIKFVVKDENDLNVAKEDYHLLTTKRGVVAEFWVTPVWDAYDAQSIIEFVQKHKLPWRLSVQTHKYIYDPDKRGV